MAALKNLSMALALIFAVSFVGVDVAKAQTTPQPLGNINCTAFSVPTLVRSEGLAEAFGDFRTECTNTGQTGQLGLALEDYIRTNIQIDLQGGVNVTNAINVGATGFTGAVLIINENNAYDPRTTSVLGPGLPVGAPVTAGDCGAADARFPCPQKGKLVGTNTIVWDDVLFPVPGAPNDPNNPTADCADGGVGQAGTGVGTCFPRVIRLRIANIRGNATIFGQGTSLPDILGRLTITGPTSISVDDAIKTLATPRIGLVTSVTTTATGLQCIGLFDETATIRLTEGFAASFKTLGTASFEAGGRIAESGYPLLVSNSPAANAQTNGGTGGGATQETQFQIVFANIPAGVTISVPRHVNNAAEAGACQDPGNVDGDALCISLLPYSAATGYQTVTLSSGGGVVTYGVMDGNPFSLENISIIVNVNAPPDTANDKPAIGAGTASVTFYPLSTVAVASNNPRPRFVDTGDTPKTIVQIFRCTTTLLFPFVSNDAGFDTGIAISNTSDDWIGTDPQRGACTIHYIGTVSGGENDKPEETSSILEGGQQLVFTLSGSSPDALITGNPGFQGFIIAECEFQFAHGFAFISDGYAGPSVNVAHGYLALVIPRDSSGGRRAGEWHYDADSNSFLTDQFGERLGQ
jgi:hypothetical protein